MSSLSAALPAVPALDLELLGVPALIVRGDEVLGGNARARELLGEPAGRSFASVLPREPADRRAGRWRVALSGADGVPVLFDVHDTGPGEARVVLLAPVTEEALLEQSVLQHEVAFTRSPTGMAFFNPSGEYVRVNPALCALLGRAEGELLGRRDQELTHPEHRAADVAAAWRILAGEIDCWQTEKRFVRPDGSVVWAIANMTFLRDACGRPLHWLGQFQDITKRKALEAKLLRLADEDPLTGLPNRRCFERELSSMLALARRHEVPAALLLLDLDAFKAINDLHGHAAGDAALVAVARALRSRLRRSDTLARVGGDEFALLLPHTDERAARGTAEQLRATVRASEPVVGVGLEVSVGVVAFDHREPASPDELLARADADMYADKRGRAQA